MSPGQSGGWSYRIFKGFSSLSFRWSLKCLRHHFHPHRHAKESWGSRETGKDHKERAPLYLRNGHSNSSVPAGSAILSLTRGGNDQPFPVCGGSRPQASTKNRPVVGGPQRRQGVARQKDEDGSPGSEPRLISMWWIGSIGGEAWELARPEKRHLQLLCHYVINQPGWRHAWGCPWDQVVEEIADSGKREPITRRGVCCTHPQWWRRKMWQDGFRMAFYITARVTQPLHHVITRLEKRWPL